MIDVRDVVKIHAPHTPREVRALDGISFTIPTGSFAAVVGESGSGKTTLLHLLGALDRPTSGTVAIDGRELERSSRRELAKLRARTVGFVFQNFDLIPSLTALENIMLAARYAGCAQREARARALELLSEVGVADRSDHLPSELSGGQQQRVAIARALVNEPGVVLADEPTGELDSKTAEQIVGLLRRLNDSRGVTMVIVTHNRELYSLCSPVITLADGRMVA
ncbi:MAG: ABC transporter ATP-binding protein [Vulcanimicrobiaceae bacterium]